MASDRINLMQALGINDVIEAKEINISETGICFESNGNLPFEMQFKNQHQTPEASRHLKSVSPLFAPHLSETCEARMF